MSSKGMSLESMLDEERRDVLALLEGTAVARKKSATSMNTARAASPLNKPQSPVQSMLDIDDDFVAWHSSLTSANGVATSPRTLPIRSMLDFGGTPPGSPPIRSMLEVSVTPNNAAPPPAEHNQKAKVAQGVHPRSHSDAATRPASFGPRSINTGVDVEAAYQFTGFLPRNPGGPFQPRRNTQGGKRRPFPSALSEAVRGGDLSVFARDRGRSSIPGSAMGSFSGAKSRSPHNRLGLRSNSPQVSPDSSKFTLDDGREIYSNSAYKMLSDANLASSGGNLSSLGKKGGIRRTNSVTTSLPDNTRLQKDYTPVDGEGVSDDSSDERQQSSDEERPRGRKMHVIDLKTGMYPDGEGYLPNTGPRKGNKTALSLLAAAEEERQEIAAQQNAIVNAKAKYKIRSLLEPAITVTGPGGERSHRTSKPGVHPNTSFDEGASGLDTPVDSDTEQDLTDIKRAQKLSVNMTSVASTPVTSRSVRTIYRGDFAKMQQEALDNQRRVRKYLVATDLSEEAAHALEWTIGTVLRDGDTLLAIYCVDEETGIVANEGSADDSHVKEQVVAIAAATRPSGSTPVMSANNAPSPLSQGAFRLESISSNASPMGREQGKQEQERFRAVQDITDRVARLLRKTKLQVKVVIEVIHCKSPKHLITEVIDYISPTLVILGSRGRSALKGVILGSFSNYLVTKSSVPVMVARKRLRKHTKYKRPAVRLANNLANPAIKKTLAAAKIDELG